MHDFVFKKNSVVDRVVAKVRKFCYGGTFEDAKIHVNSGRDTSECAIPDQESYNYKCLGKMRSLSDSKSKHLQQMYKEFISRDRWPPFLSWLI